MPAAIGYSAAIVWLTMRVGQAGILWPLAAVGRTALSCYLLQTILCTTIFYGHGLGWFGQVDRVHQQLIVVCIWALELILAPLWLKFFRFGPLEWIWRSATYAKWQPLLR